MFALNFFTRTRDKANESLRLRGQFALGHGRLLRFKEISKICVCCVSILLLLLHSTTMVLLKSLSERPPCQASACDKFAHPIALQTQPGPLHLSLLSIFVASDFSRRPRVFLCSSDASDFWA